MSQTNRQYETNPDRMRTNQWIFGNNNFIKFYPNNQADSFKINSLEASSVLSSEQGRVLLYTDGETVWDSMNKVVVSGLLGSNSSSMGTVFYYNKSDSTVILFNTNSAQSLNKEFSYSKFKLTYLGISVLVKNIVLQTQVCEPLALVNAKDGHNAWIVCHGFDNNIFYSYNIYNGIIEHCPKISITGNFNGGNKTSSGRIDIKFSNNGKYILKSNLNFPFNGERAQIFSFDNENGNVKILYSIPNLLYPFTGLHFLQMLRMSL
jgi:hypothetical protein